MDSGSIGFNAPVVDKNSQDLNELLHNVQPQDLIKFGIIPEMVGRVPVTVTLDLLDEDALIRILTEPKNALVKQYQALFDMDEIKLTFSEDALHEVARQAKERKTGARGLRAILEKVMQDIMFELPSDEMAGSVEITKETVQGTGKPIVKPRRVRLRDESA